MVFPVVGGTQSTGYDIDNSLRLSKDSATYVYKDFDDTGTLNTKGTFSWWNKIYQQSSDMYMMSVRNDASPEEHIHIRYQNPMLQGQFYKSSSQYAQIITNNYFRDHTAWMHFVLKMDSTDGTANNRIRLFVNNQEVSYATQSMPNQNQDFIISKVATHQFGNHYSGTGSHFDGGLADVHFIDGQAKDPTDFGETNDNGVWIPKQYTGTYGDHGYRLEFKQTGTSQNSSGIGADTSGNDNHFACNSLVALDIVTDTPTNNFCTFNPLSNSHQSFIPTLSEGNTIMSSDGADAACFGTFGVSNGKWYWELKGTESDNGGVQKWTPGVIGAEDHSEYSNRDGGYAPKATSLYLGNSNVYQNNSSVSSAYFTATQNDIIQIAFDADNNKIYFGKNGTYGNSGDPTSGATGTGGISTTAAHAPFIPIVGEGSGHEQKIEANFGNAPYSISSGNSDANGYGNFEFAVPSGYYALCTKNLAKYG